MAIQSSAPSLLSVKLSGRPIGTITHLGGERTIFAFDEAYIKDADRAVLSLGFKNQFGDLITDFRPYKIKLMPFFSNLLPEGYMREFLAKRAGVNPNREFLLLGALGADLPGAVTVEPIEMGGAVEALSEAQEQSGEEDDVLRFSLAGVQLKFSAVAGAHGGLTIPSSDMKEQGDWIIKLPSREFGGVPENEFSMMHLAKLVGMDVPDIDLVGIDTIRNLPRGMERIGAQAFIIKRFDRSDAGRVHMEDFAQVFGVYADAKYKKASMANIARVLAAETGEGNWIEFIRRLTFNTLIGNGDMHLKNWSLIYPNGRGAKLSPAYDFVSTIAYIEGDKSALKISRSKAFTDFTEDELDHLCAKAGLPRGLVRDTARETVAKFMQVWAAEKNNLPMGGDVKAAIEKHLRTLPIVG